MTDDDAIARAALACTLELLAAMCASGTSFRALAVERLAAELYDLDLTDDERQTLGTVDARGRSNPERIVAQYFRRAAGRTSRAPTQGRAPLRAGRRVVRMSGGDVLLLHL